MRRSWLLVLFLGVVLVGGVVAVDITRNLTGGSKKLCSALEVRVAGMDSFRWDNGFTGSAASWGLVLTDGVSKASDADRIRIADAVTADRSGYEAFLDALPESSRPVARRLHDLAVSPSAVPEATSASSVDEDVTELFRLGHEECGFA